MASVRTLRNLVVVLLMSASTEVALAAEDGRAPAVPDAAVQTDSLDPDAAKHRALQAISDELKALQSSIVDRRDLLAAARLELEEMKAAIDRLLADGNGAAPPSEEPEAIAAFVRPAAAVRDVPQVAPKPRPVVTLHLASYRNQGQAEQGWQILRARNGDLLQGVEAVFVVIDLGPGKGQYTRIVVEVTLDGDICSRLKARGEYCEPLT